MEECEKEVMRLEAEKADIEQRLSTPEGAADMKLGALYSDTERLLNVAEETWAQAVEELEKFDVTH